MDKSKVEIISDIIIHDQGRFVCSEEIKVGSRFGSEDIKINYLNWRGRFVKIYESLEDGFVFAISEPVESFQNDLKYKSIFEFTQSKIDRANLEQILQRIQEAPRDASEYLIYLKQNIEKLKEIL